MLTIHSHLRLNIWLSSTSSPEAIRQSQNMVVSQSGLHADLVQKRITMHWLNTVCYGRDVLPDTRTSVWSWLPSAFERTLISRIVPHRKALTCFLLSTTDSLINLQFFCLILLYQLCFIYWLC